MTTDQFQALKNKFNGTFEGLTRLEQQQLLEEVERLMKLVADVGRTKAPDVWRPATGDRDVEGTLANIAWSEKIASAVASNERIVGKADRMRQENKIGGPR